MPIYDYECSHCGHKAEVMRKLSEPSLTTCPACQQETFAKQLSAPSFQLTGSGWYATDFKSGAKTETAVAETKPAESSPTPCGGGCACH